MKPLVITDGVPVPSVKYNRTGITSKLRELKVGQCVFIPGKRSEQMSTFLKLSGLTGKATMRTGDGGVTVWRVRD